MISRRFSRSEILLGAGAATMASLAAACDHVGSSLPQGPVNSAGGISPSFLPSHAVEVAQPTGSAIQAAINAMGPGGGSIYLTATQPYIISQTIVINKNNIKLIGKGPRATQLVAKSGAVLTAPGHTEECMLLVQGATNVSIIELLINTINQANSSGNPRLGIGAWSSTSLRVNGVTCIENLGPNGFNQGLSFNQCTNVTVTKCEVTQSRTGISIVGTKGFVLTTCLVRNCAAQAPSYPGPVNAIAISSSSSGRISSCTLTANKVNAGISVSNSTDLTIKSSKIFKTLAFPTQPANDGIAFDLSAGANRIVVERCELVENSGAGVSATRSSNIHIKENSFINNGTSANGGAGISLNGDTQYMRVRFNHIGDDHGVLYGIKAGYSSSLDSNVHIFDNTVHGFGAGVALGSSSKGCEVENNNLRLNTDCVTNAGTDNHVSNNLC